MENKDLNKQMEDVQNALSDGALDKVAGGTKMVTIEYANRILMSDEPPTEYAKGKLTTWQYMTSWDKLKISDLHGARRAEAIRLILGNEWQARCTPEIYNLLMGVEP